MSLPQFIKNQVFELGSDLYDYFTWQDTWWKHSKKLSETRDNPESIIDLGCGPGISSFALEEKHPDALIIGIDMASRMIQKAQTTQNNLSSNCKFLLGDAGQLPFPRDYFDLATGHSFLYLLDDPERILKEIHHVLKPNAGVTFLEPRKNPGYGWITSEWEGGIRFLITMIGWQIMSALSGRFDQESLKKILENSNFKEITTEITLGGLGLIVRAEK